MLLQSQKLGVDIIYDVVEKVNFSINPFICIGEDGEEYAGKNIVIATGAKPKYLGISGEKEYIGYGVSTCATCDGNFFKNKTVAVVGGGNVAAIEALHLTHLASKVCVIYRKSEFFRVEDPILERLNKADNIEFLFDSEVEEIIGVNEPKKVTGVKIFNIKNQKHDILNLDGVFVAIGREPNTNIFKDSGLQLNEKNYIITKPNSAKTNMGGIYAVGDVSDKGFRQAIVASGWGCVAALEIAESII
jgi:thioredoxin reductase (NADPH)